MLAVIYSVLIGANPAITDQRPFPFFGQYKPSTIHVRIVSATVSMFPARKNHGGSGRGPLMHLH